MARSAALVVLLAGTILACGCSAHSGSNAADVESASMEWRLKTLEQKSLAFQNAQLELASRMNKAEGRLDSLESGAKLGEQDLSAPREVPPEPLMSSDSLPEPGPAAKPGPKADDAKAWDQYPDATAATAAAAAAAPAAPEAKAEKKPAKPAQKAAPKKYPVKAAPAAPGKAAYDKGLALVLAGKTKEARTAFEGFLAKNAKSPLAPNAQYWLGETYYHEKRFPESIVAFKKVHQNFPRHSKAPAALLKIGYAYAQLGDKENARFYLGVLLQDYPKSEPAPKAKKRLESL
ncbi:tol-pal system protein YbgF [Desulfocurvus sp. DL9XJH121]